MNTKLTETCFKGMNGAYAALFTPYDAKGRVNPEMIESDNARHRQVRTRRAVALKGRNHGGVAVFAGAAGTPPLL